MRIGIIVSLIGIGILAYDHYIRTIGDTQHFVAYALIILGIFFIFFGKRVATSCSYKAALNRN